MATQSKTQKSAPTTGRRVVKCRQISAPDKEGLFNIYIKPNFASIKSLTRRYTDHWQDVEENYNYCLAQLFNYIGSYNPEQKLDTWIHICVKRACFHQNKKRAEEASHWTDIEMCSMDDLYQHGNSMMVDASFGTLLDNISDEVYAALVQIPPQRLSPLMMAVQGHRIREITEAEWKLGHLEKRSEDVVKSRIHWAKKQLRFILQQYGITRTNYKGQDDDPDFDTEDD